VLDKYIRWKKGEGILSFVGVISLPFTIVRGSVKLKRVIWKKGVGMRRRGKKLKFLLYFSFLILVLGGNTGCRKVEECISLEGAREIVLYKVVGTDTMEWDTTKIRVYELPYMLEKGDTIILRREDEMGMK